MTLQHRTVAGAAALLCLLTAAASATVIYEHHFSGNFSTYLNGLSPDVGANAWIAHSGWNRGWRNDGTPYRYSSATLPFTPQTGKVYLLSARLTDVVGGNDWLALGFTAGSSTGRDTNADRFIEGTTAGQLWMIRRGNAATQNDQTFTGPGTNGSADIATLDRSKDVDYRIRLDTRQANWTAEWMQKTTDQPAFQVVRTHTYSTNPTIAAAGLAHGNSGVDGRIAWFRLEELDLDFSITSNGQPADMAVLEGHNAVFETRFVSSQTPTVTWYRMTDDHWQQLLPAPGLVETSLTYDSDIDEYRAILTLLNIAAQDEGFYYCDIAANGFSIQSLPAGLTVKQMLAHWTLNAEDYLHEAHLDTVAGLKLIPAAAPVFIPGAAGTAAAAIQVGSSGAGTSEPLSAMFADGFTLSLWTNPAENAALTVTDDSVSLPGGDVVGGQWRHLCLVVDGQTAALYLDGRLKTQQPWPLSTTYEMVLELGCAFLGQTPLAGAVDDVRLYNFTLTDDDVYELYARRTEDAGCVLDYAYRFDLSGPDGWPDCRLDLYDFVELARQWLDTQEPSTNLADLMDFAHEWLTTGLDLSL